VCQVFILQRPFAYDSTACRVFTDTSTQTFYFTVFIPQSQPHLVANGDTLTITNFTTGLQWYRNNIILPNDTNQRLTVPGTGCYQAIETDANDCTSMSDTVCINFTGIPSVTDNHNISIYPNPNDGSFTLHYSLPTGNSQLLIKDVTGRLLYSMANLQGFKNLEGLAKAHSHHLSLSVG